MGDSLKWSSEQRGSSRRDQSVFRPMAEMGTETVIFAEADEGPELDTQDVVGLSDDEEEDGKLQRVDEGRSETTSTGFRKSPSSGASGSGSGQGLSPHAKGSFLDA